MGSEGVKVGALDGTDVGSPGEGAGEVSIVGSWDGSDVGSDDGCIVGS